MPEPARDRVSQAIRGRLGEHAPKLKAERIALKIIALTRWTKDQGPNSLMPNRRLGFVPGLIDKRLGRLVEHRVAVTVARVDIDRPGVDDRFRLWRG